MVTQMEQAAGQGRQAGAGRQPEPLTTEQKRFYAENGYLVFEDVLSASELAALREASERLGKERKKLGGDTRLAVIHNVALMDDAFMMAARHPFMLSVVSDLVGENPSTGSGPALRLQHCKLNWKPPTIGAGEVGWHQDFPFFPHTNYDLLACMFLLDDATPENGCMRMFPGSHKRGPVDHYDAQGKFTGRATDPRDWEEDERAGNVADLVVPAGSMTVHHCCTLHASYPNRSANPRRGLVYQIAAGDAIQLGGNLHKVYGMWLKGSDPLRARLLDGTTFRLTAPLTNRGGLEPTGDWKTITQD
jgi:ectoine hydroxylase-related dioxygenase (phytanoyl-CoA dioxygenase family)